MKTRLRSVIRVLQSEHDSPARVGSAVAVGVWIGLSPAILFHIPIAVGLATLFRLNRLWAAVSTKVGNLFTIPWIAIAEVQISHRLRTGGWVSFSRHDAMAMAKTLVVDWCVGWLIVGSAFSIACGLVAYFVVRRRRIGID